MRTVYGKFRTEGEPRRIRLARETKLVAADDTVYPDHLCDMLNRATASLYVLIADGKFAEANLMEIIIEEDVLPNKDTDNAQG